MAPMLDVFKGYQNEKIAIYGLSTETEKALPWLSKLFKVVGLLDGFRTEGMLFGYPIISMEKAVSYGIKLVVVVARPGSCKAIAKRIGEECKAQGIALLDIRGKDLLQSNKVVYNFKATQGYKYADLVKKIEEVGAVSFDLFDTLVMRTILTSTDVIALVETKLQEKGIEIKDFALRRLVAEKELSQKGAPRLTDIYKHVLGTQSGLDEEVIATLEYEVDCALLVPRREMVALFNSVKKQGKPVYITTDSYYNKEQIHHILSLFGIENYDALFVSCEYNTSKTQDLFYEMKNQVREDKILHIGNDIVSDIQGSEKHGFNSFLIYSGEELLDAVGGLGLAEFTETLSDRIRIGMFVANIFNNPFQFETEERRICVENAFDVGYLFCAPMILDFVKWFGEQVQKKHLRNIWFCARDGYVIQKVFEKVYPGIVSEYFLTSRTAAIRAGVETEGDIIYVDGMKYAGTVEDNLKQRFGLEASTIKLSDISKEKDGLLRYGKAILNAGKINRANYQKYIDKLKIDAGGIAFFDFVAKGTSQVYLQRLVENEITGVYFLQLEPELMRDKKICIEPFYTEKERENSVIFDNYYILETILTSPEPSVEEFDEDGEPKYTKETRTQDDIVCFMQSQKGILAYVEWFLNICPGEKWCNNKRLSERFLMLLQRVEILDEHFLRLEVEDPFFNRRTSLKDIL